MFMREVCCEVCQKVTRHSIPALQRIARLQSESYEDGVYINYLCPSCSYLSRSAVPLEVKTFDVRNLAKHPDDLSDFLVYLKCERKNCKSPVVLLAPVKLGAKFDDLVQVAHTAWKLMGAACDCGHPPIHPFQIREYEYIPWSYSYH
jgi:hypothetical protein